jgi:UDP-2,3-diacylglucosamine pyrophosphatase LpxH
MLIIISDLHFVDGTAGEHNLPVSAFENVLFSDIITLARNKNAKEIKLVLLGDIIDVLRSEQWFRNDFPLADRPWGDNGLRDIAGVQHDSATEQRCLEILGRFPDDGKKPSEPEDTILYKNWETFEFFRQFAGKLLDEFQNDLPVEIIYVPGNHDRLCNLYPSVRDEVKKMLGLTVTQDTVLGDPNEDWWYRCDFMDETHGVYARHGHQYDPWNYGGGNDYTRRGHIQASIGDVITTEFAVKIPYTLASMKDSYPEVTDELVDKVKEIDNVRPLNRVMEWLRYRIKKEDCGQVRKALDKAFDKVISEMLDIEFVQQWRSPQTRWDEVLRAMSSRWLRWLPKRLLDRLDVEDLLPLFFAVTGGSDDPEKDDHAIAAYGERIWKESKKIRFVLYGHTHSPMQLPLDGRTEHMDDEGGNEAVYINTGTWRERIYRTIGLDKAYDFVNLKQMTYTVFYRRDEDTKGKAPRTLSFEVWTGAKKKHYQQ